MNIRSYGRWLLVAPLALLVLLLAAACGDDNSNSSSSSGGSSSGGGNGSDAQFMADICKAAKTFSTDLQKAMTDPNIAKDPSKAAAAISGPFSNFSDAFAKANPPSDLKQWHDDASTKFKDYVANLKKSNDVTAALSGGNPIPDPPQAAVDRLDKLAASNQDCKDSNFNFGQ